MIYNVTGSIMSTQKVLFTVPRKPYGGKLVCTPIAGKAFVTKVNCTASGWIVVENSIKYQFFTKEEKSGQ